MRPTHRLFRRAAGINLIRDAVTTRATIRTAETQPPVGVFTGAASGSMYYRDGSFRDALRHFVQVLRNEETPRNPRRLLRFQGFCGIVYVGLGNRCSIR